MKGIKNTWSTAASSMGLLKKLAIFFFNQCLSINSPLLLSELNSSNVNFQVLCWCVTLILEWNHQRKFDFFFKPIFFLVHL
jgi:hypothetical protein